MTYDNIVTGTFLKLPNRFIAYVDVNGDFKTIPSLYLLYVFSWTITAVAEIIYFLHIYKNTFSQKTAVA